MLELIRKKLLVGDALSAEEWQQFLARDSDPNNPKNDTYELFRGYTTDTGLGTYQFLLDDLEVSNKSLLEIGCSNGILLDYLLTTISGYVGIDSDSVMLDIAKDKYCNRDNVEFFSKSIQDFAPENKYDLVVSHMVHHMLKEQKLALTKIFDLIKPRGQYVAVIRNLDDAEGATDVLSQIRSATYDYFSKHYPKCEVRPKGHIYSVSDYKAMAADIGFHELSVVDYEISKEETFDSITTRYIHKMYPSCLLEGEEMHEFSDLIRSYFDSSKLPISHRLKKLIFVK